MARKSLAVLAIMFVVQSVFSCIPCDCPKSQIYDVKYKSIALTAYDTSGLQDKVMEDTINKNAFGITVAVNFELERIAKLLDINGNFGFNAAMACDCVGNEYNYSDPIDRIEIFVTDSKTSQTREITDHFAIYGDANGGLISLKQYFNNRHVLYEKFQLRLVTFDLIPSAATFTVNTYLESGKKLSKQTGQINFF